MRPRARKLTLIDSIPIHLQQPVAMKNLTVRKFAPCLTSLLVGICMGTVQAEMREFKSLKGAVIKAELKKAKGQMIFLRNEDGKEVQLPLTQFSKDDQTFILKWMTEDPLALDYNFNVKVEEKIAPATKKVSNNSYYYERISASQKNYNISIQNRSSNPLNDITVDWCAFMLNNVTLSSSGSYSSSSGIGELRFKHGSLEIASMPVSHSASIVTPNFTVESVIDKYYTGAKTKDKLQGVWLRFYRGATLVSEWKSTDCPKMEWPAGEHVTKEKAPEIAKNDTPNKSTKNTSSKQPSGTPTSEQKVPSKESDDDMGDIVKIFELDSK